MKFRIYWLGSENTLNTVIEGDDIEDALYKNNMSIKGIVHYETLTVGESLEEAFNVISITRKDLTNFFPVDVVETIDDFTMNEIADMLAEALMAHGYNEALETAVNEVLNQD